MDAGRQRRLATPRRCTILVLHTPLAVTRAACSRYGIDPDFALSAVHPLHRNRNRAAVRPILVAAVAVICAGWAVLSAWNGVTASGTSVGAAILRALWVMPGLVALHLTQLLLAGIAWRCLFEVGRLEHRLPGIATFYRLRVIREGIDSLLPVVQVGGEFVGAQLLSRAGVPPSRAGASVIVDLTVELLTQVMFLCCGLAALASLSRAGVWGVWPQTVLTGVLVAGGFLLAQRFGAVAALEALLCRIAGRWPALGGATVTAASLAGLNRAALDFYRRPAAMGKCVSLHLLAWAIGTAETWIVLRVLHSPVTVLQALAVESLGMAARSAGFAIPGAIGVQEGGFVLAAMAVGLPAAPGLCLSLIKRIREISVGLIGIALWRWAIWRSDARRTAR